MMQLPRQMAHNLTTLVDTTYQISKAILCLPSLSQVIRVLVTPYSPRHLVFTVFILSILVCIILRYSLHFLREQCIWVPKGKKPDSKCYIIYEFIYTTFWKMKSKGTKNIKYVCQGLGVVSGFNYKKAWGTIWEVMKQIYILIVLLTVCIFQNSQGSTFYF